MYRFQAALSVQVSGDVDSRIDKTIADPVAVVANTTGTMMTQTIGLAPEKPRTRAVRLVHTRPEISAVRVVLRDPRLQRCRVACRLIRNIPNQASTRAQNNMADRLEGSPAGLCASLDGQPCQHHVCHDRGQVERHENQFSNQALHEGHVC